MISYWEFSPETLFQSAFFFFLFQDLLLLDPKIDEIRFYFRVLFKKKIEVHSRCFQGDRLRQAEVFIDRSLYFRIL